MISNRIIEISKMVDSKNTGVFDVGSDHGYLLLSLHEMYQDMKLTGVENKKGPFLNLSKNIKNKNINALFSDGIDDLDDSFSCIVLAGMGYLNIKNIILKHINKLNYINQIIIDSHNDIKECREFFTSLGFYIEKEKIIKEDNIFYEIISFKKGENKYSLNELIYGPILLKEHNEIFKEKYKLMNQKIELILDKLDKESIRYQELKEIYIKNLEVINL